MEAPGTIRAMKRRRLLTITIAIAITTTIAAFTPAASAATTPLHSLAGRWIGVLNGAKPKITVTVDLTGQWNGSRIVLAGGINCDGPLTFVGRGAAAYRFIEHITNSTSAGCTLSRGTATFTPRADGRLGYAWRLQGGGQSATATLRRSAS